MEISDVKKYADMNPNDEGEHRSVSGVGDNIYSLSEKIRVAKILVQSKILEE